ncbi:MAG: hypothetical protein J6R85_02615, partial [Lentisphaeria bacterium]|nr:hypothetical protein [Lentisphaeria bacterium]
GVPIFWLPFAHKPKSESLGLFQAHGGRSGDWGIFISLSKKYQLADYPDTTAKVYTDYYEYRGFGYGVRVRSNMENSKTELFAYGLYDKDRYESTDPRKYGIKIPYQRFDFRISNVTHITPTLDFRANLEWLSDEYFTDDFFHSHYSANPQPVTFAALEQQWEHATASVYIRPQINDFFTTVEQLPTLQLNVQRQELFDSNIYYQGDHSLGYFQRKWRDFNDRDNYKAPYDYRSGRVDSVNFLYYPLKFDLSHIIPRAGVRLTGYTETSENPINDEELALLLNSSNPSYQELWVNDYDGKGDSELRFIAEFGVEVNTKIYRTWQDIRSDWLQLDGLRHIIVPYLNYTFIPEPTGDREKLYYFDDIDRIDEQHFVRFGVINRLQTRRNDQLVNYLTMENYIDLHLEDEDGFNHVGDFCTRLSMSPLKGLTFSTFFSVDAGDKDKIGDDDQTVMRRGRNAGHPGLYLDWLNRWEVTMRYEPIRDFVFSMTYNYQNRHRTRSAYSMGSSLDDIESGGSFTRYYLTQTQEISAGIRVPLTPDRRTFGAYTITYDVNAGYVSNQTLALVRQFHCWEVAAELSFDTDYDSDGDKDHETSFYITAYLTGLVGPLQEKQNALMNNSRNMQSL